MATLQQVIDQIQDTVGAISGIVSAPHEPPDQVSQWPFVAAYVKSGTWILGKPAGQMTGLHNIVVELHIARKDLPRDVTKAMTYAKSVPNAIGKAWLVSVTLSALEAIGPIEYEFTEMEWGGVITLGFRWTLTAVKTIDTFA